MVIEPPRRHKSDATWEYQWELIDLDDNVVKQGRNTIDLRIKEIRKYHLAREKRATFLGNLHPNKQYRLFLVVADEYGNNLLTRLH